LKQKGFEVADWHSLTNQIHRKNNVPLNQGYYAGPIVAEDQSEAKS
jgi:hypothetical protein